MADIIKWPTSSGSRCSIIHMVMLPLVRRKLSMENSSLSLDLAAGFCDFVAGTAAGVAVCAPRLEKFHLPPLPRTSRSRGDGSVSPTARKSSADHPEPSEEDIRREMSGNLCRCGTYPKIVRAVTAVARGDGASRG